VNSFIAHFYPGMAFLPVFALLGAVVGRFS